MIETDKHNLEVLLRSHFPVIVIETHEEKRAMELLTRVSLQDGRRLLRWTAATGLQEGGFTGRFEPSSETWSVKDDPDSREPLNMLMMLHKMTRNSLVVLVDFHPYISEPQVLRELKEIALEAADTGNRLILVSHDLDVPPGIAKLCTSLSLSLPDEKQIRDLVMEEARAWSMSQQKKVKTDREALERLIRNLSGLTLTDARRIVRNAITVDGAITEEDVTDAMQSKYRLADKNSLLSFEYDTASFADVGGFVRLKKWLDVRKKPFLAGKSANGDRPRGVLLLGVQGCGKSLAAKSIAGVWGVPLLRLDFGAVYNKYIGESEKNIREALAAAEVLAPCVLWIDEIEKGIQVSGEDSGTARRILGTFLTWMAENSKPVFIVATANDIEALPPELVRKGRMDEIFFVDLPDEKERADILGIHLMQRKIKPGGIDVAAIARGSEGFSGAELEQAVVSAYYVADADGKPVTTDLLMGEIEQTRPLSQVMREKIAGLRAWAKGRTVSAN